MSYDLSDKLVVGVASSALFDLTESDAYFHAEGETAYRKYSDEHVDDVLEPGAAFPFIQRLLGLNDLRTQAPLVEVIVLSHNDPQTGLRVMRSVRAHDLQITRAAFTQGLSPYKYMHSLEMSLFLTANKMDVEEAVREDLPAGRVLPSTAQYDPDDKSLIVAFDFDGVLADDEAERVYRDESFDAYRAYEDAHRKEPLNAGPLKPLLEDLNRIQRVEDAKVNSDPGYQRRLRIALVTARNAPAHERAIYSLRGWGVSVNDAFFLGGIAKEKVLKVLQPHIYFDDQGQQLQRSLDTVVGVHVPYGVANEAPN